MTQKHYDIIQQQGYPHPGYQLWSVIQGKRAGGGYPQGIEGKDWKTIERDLSREEALFIAQTLTDLSIGP